MSEPLVDGGGPWLPVGLAILSAFLFGMAGITSKRGVTHIDPQVAVIISLGSTLTFFLITSPFWMRAEDWFSLGFWVFAVNGLMHPLLSMYCWMEAIQRAGATVASTLTATAPLFAAFTAIVFLGESLSMLIALGTLLTIAGVAALSFSRVGITHIMKAALLFATASALVRGVNHTVGKFGMSLMPNPLMAAFISCAVAFVGSLLLYRARNGRFPAAVARAGIPFMVATGIFAGGGISSMYSALNVGDVVVVSPLVATYPVFTFVAALLLAMERFTIRLGLGVSLVVCGVMAITLGRG